MTGLSPGAVSGSSSGQASRDAADALLAELQTKLAGAARKCYPREAARFRLQGKVPLAFCLSTTGIAQATRLEGSTGSPLLDRAARECVLSSAGPLPPRVGCYTVLVQFGG